MRTFLKIAVALLLIAAVAAGALWALQPRQRSAICLWLAEKALESGNDTAATKLFEDSLKIYPGNSAARKAAISFYRARGNYTKVEYHLLGGIENESGNSYYYEELSRVYVEQGKLYDASNLLDNIENAVVYKKLSSMRPQAPVILPESGNYRGELSVTVTAPEGALVYLTDSGSFPSGDDLFDGEIEILPGETLILAVCVSPDGLVSTVASASYRFEPELASITFSDPGVERIVRDILARPAGDISTGDMRTISSFSNAIGDELVEISTVEDLRWCSGLEVLDLTGVKSATECLEYLPSLRILSLHDCSVTDLTVFSGLKEIEYLDLSRNTIALVDALAELPKLERLIIRQNAVVNIEPLGKLVSLRQLDAGENAISDISPLDACTELETLVLDVNRISDVSALSSMKKLSALDISRNEVSDISALRDCTALRSLNMSGNKIEILEPLGGLIDLTSLDAAKNNISDISALGGLINLSVLNLSGNVIENVEPLAGCVSLNTCDLSRNFITDVSGLSALQNLMELNVENNMITDLSNLVSCEALNTVYAFGNKIKDTSALDEAGITVYK